MKKLVEHKSPFGRRKNVQATKPNNSENSIKLNMATFYPQLSSNESLSQQWQRYLQYKPVINNIEDIIQIQTKEYKDIVEQASREQVQAIQTSTEVVSGTMESGFELISENLKDISYGIDDVRSELNRMAAIFNWKLSSLIEQQRITNLLLGNIAVLLRIPDIQKERQYHIEQGIKFLKNSFFNDDFYEDALINLLKAETIEPTDFFVLHRIGYIYMFSPNNYDLNKAEIYFKRAAKYAFAETNTDGNVTTNYLAGDLDKDLLSQIPTPSSIKPQAAESYMFAGRSCYLQAKFSEAAELAGKAFALVPQMVEAGFTQALALSADDKLSEAVVVLTAVIERDRFYSIKTEHLDLSSKIEIQNLLEKFRQDAFNEACNLLSECKKNIIDESIVKDEVVEIERLVDKKSFLHCKKAIDLINIEKERTFSDISPENKNGDYQPDRYFNEIIESVQEITNLLEANKPVSYTFKKVRQPAYVAEIKKMFLFLSENTQWEYNPKWDFYCYDEYYKNDLNENFYSCEFTSKTLSSNLLVFIKQEKIYFEKLPLAKAHVNKVLKKLSDDEIKGQKEDEIEHAKWLVERQKEKNAASLKYAFREALGWGGTCAFIGAIIRGFTGCLSCLDVTTETGGLWADYNFFSGALQGAIGGAIIGALIGVIIGVVKGQKDPW